MAEFFSLCASRFTSIVLCNYAVSKGSSGKLIDLLINCLLIACYQQTQALAVLVEWWIGSTG